MTVFSVDTCDTATLTRIIKDKALELGYADVGITTADEFVGYREEMESRPNYQMWFDRQDSPYQGADPRAIMPEAKSIISVVFDFSKTTYPDSLTRSIGRAYLGRGYLSKPESINGTRRIRFIEFLKNLGMRVDESGVMRFPERLAGARAGVVTFGKNNLVYTKKGGSFVILTGFLVDTELEYDEPTMKRPCPDDCNKCVEACPSGALYEPGKLDYRKCLLARQVNPLSIDDELKQAMGLSIHGCDRCQEVCPRNEPVLERASEKDPFIERLAKEFDLEKVLLMDDAYYEQFMYPVMYNYITERWLFQRNAAIALGNTKDSKHLPALKQAKQDCPEEVQEYIDWAIEQIEG